MYRGVVQVLVLVTAMAAAAEMISEGGTDFDYSKSIKERARKCQPSSSCTDAGGFCVKKSSHCEGTSNGKLCKGKKCKCCITGCVFGDTTYAHKETLETCMELKCLHGVWHYKGRTNKVCGNCGFHGDTPGLITFDQHTRATFGFNESGTYVITQNGLEDSQEFGINATFAMGGDPLVSYITSATYYEAGILVDLILPSRNLTVYCNDPSNDPDNNPLCVTTVLVNGEVKTIGKTVNSYDAADGTVLIFENHQISDDFIYEDDDLLCINIVVSKGFSVNLCQQFAPWGYVFLHIRAMPILKGQPSELYGLCDTFTGTEREYYTARNGSHETDTEIFAESWKIGKASSLESLQRRFKMDAEDDGSCDCTWYNGGCKITTVASKANSSCHCYYWGAFHCTGEFRDFCMTSSSPWCITPDTTMMSCLQGDGNCGAYGYTCDCSHGNGGCTVTTAAVVNLACHCNDRAFWNCDGDITYCSDPASSKCLSPDTSQESCVQGRGNCDGY